jgi:hypothetical protein
MEIVLVLLTLAVNRNKATDMQFNTDTILVKQKFSKSVGVLTALEEQNDPSRTL